MQRIERYFSPSNSKKKFIFLDKVYWGQRWWKDLDEKTWVSVEWSTQTGSQVELVRFALQTGHLGVGVAHADVCASSSLQVRWKNAPVFGTYLCPNAVNANTKGTSAKAIWQGVSWNKWEISKTWFRGFLLFYFEISPTERQNKTNKLLLTWKKWLFSSTLWCRSLPHKCIGFNLSPGRLFYLRNYSSLFLKSERTEFSVTGLPNWGISCI